jgi:hypothetical protein
MALRASGAPETFQSQGCVDFGDGNGPIEVTSSSTSRPVRGVVVLKGQSRSVEGSISHDEVAGGPACTPE